MLTLSGKNPKYYYFQSKSEIPHLVGLFRESRYRYLHISSHADSSEIGIGKGKISYKEFADYFGDNLNLRRLFFSACQIGNPAFLKELASKNKRMYSIVAPVEDIQFDHAAAIWSCFYISLFSKEFNKMTHSDIGDTLKAITALFPTTFFFAKYNSKSKKWNTETIR